MIVTFASIKGGTTKSSSILNLLPLFKKPIIIDTDPQETIVSYNQLREKSYEIYNTTDYKDFFNIIEKNPDRNIFVDTAGNDSDLNRIIIANSDIVIIPLKDNAAEIFSLYKFLEIIKELKVNNLDIETKFFLLLSNIHPMTKDFSRVKEIVKDNSDIQIFNTVIRSRADYTYYLEYGTSIFEKKKDKKDNLAIKELKSLKKEIRKHG